MIAGNKAKYVYMVVFMLVLFFLLNPFGSNLAAQVNNNNDDEETEEVEPELKTRFKEVLNHYSIGFWHTGIVSHEHDFAVDRIRTAFFAAGLGEARGSQDILTVRSPLRTTVNHSEAYFAATDINAILGQYMRMITTFSIDRNNSATSGVEPNPGETGYLRTTVASNSDQDGKYLKYDNRFGTTDGTARLTSEVGNGSATVDVQGSSRVWEQAKVEDGGAKTGWWDLD